MKVQARYFGLMCSSIAILLPLLWTTAICADGLVFRDEITLVKVEARVYDRVTRQPIRNLQSSDFSVHDEDQPRNIVYFGADSTPLDVLLLLDISGSMRELLPAVAAQAVDALSRLRSGDCVAVMAFAKSWMMTTPLTRDFPAVADGIRRAFSAHIGTDTDISKAVVAGARYLQHGDLGRRRVILVMTDNMQDTNITDRSVENDLFEADAALDALVLRGRIELPRFLRGSGVFRFAARTGGEVIESNSPDERVGEMLARIRARYTIHFRPVDTRSAHPRRIKVDLSAAARRKYPNAIVRGRDRYYPRFTLDAAPLLQAAGWLSSPAIVRIPRAPADHTMPELALAARAFSQVKEPELFTAKAASSSHNLSLDSPCDKARPQILDRKRSGLPDYTALPWTAQASAATLPNADLAASKRPSATARSRSLANL